METLESRSIQYDLKTFDIFKRDVLSLSLAFSTALHSAEVML